MAFEIQVHDYLRQYVFVYLGKIVKKNDTKFRVKCIGINPFVLNTLAFASYDLV